MTATPNLTTEVFVSDLVVHLVIPEEDWYRAWEGVGILVDKDDLINYQLIISYRLLIRILIVDKIWNLKLTT